MVAESAGEDGRRTTRAARPRRGEAAPPRGPRGADAPPRPRRGLAGPARALPGDPPRVGGGTPGDARMSLAEMSMPTVGDRYSPEDVRRFYEAGYWQRETFWDEVRKQ